MLNELEISICCIYCGREFITTRACTVHMKNCACRYKEKKEKPRISGSAIISSISQTQQINDYIFEESKSKKQNCFLDTSLERYIGHMENLGTCNEFKELSKEDIQKTTKNGIEDATYMINREDNDESEMNAESTSLMKKEKDFNERMKFTHKVWSNESLGKLELLKILDKHNCASSMFKEIMGWGTFYSKKEHCSLFSTKNIMDRRSALNELEYRRDMKGMGPKIVRVDIGLKEPSFVNVTVFDFKNQLLSMFRDDELMNPDNLVLGKLVGSTFGTSSERNVNNDDELITEINDSDWYKWAETYYNKKLGENLNRLVCGIVLTIDKTHTDSRGKLCLEPVQFTLSIFNTNTRKRKSSAWKCLGFINDLEVDVNSRNHKKPINVSKEENNVKKLIYGKSTLKSISYHRILAAILKSVKGVQKDGLYWDIRLPSGEKRKVHFVFPLCLCVVDMKGARQICGSYESALCNRPSLSCMCPSNKLHDSTYKCEPVIAKDMKNSIMDDSVDPGKYMLKLKEISQHPNKENAFFELEMCEWPYGIWGLCPSEVLHQFYEGVIIYILEEFCERFLSSRYKRNLEESLQKVVASIKDQSSRDLYPVGVFTLGVLRLPRIKGIEKFACVFYICLFLHTYKSQTEYFEGKKPMKQEMKIKLNEWRKLFEMCCYYHDWVCGTSFVKKELEYKHKKIQLFHTLLKKLVKRNGEGIKNIPKFHEFLHVVRNIKRHGPPTGYSTITTEGIHHSVKEAAKLTSHHIETFAHQTSKRMHEKNIINNAFNFVKDFGCELYFGNKQQSDNEKKKTFDSLIDHSSIFVPNKKMRKDLIQESLKNTNKKRSTGGNSSHNAKGSDYIDERTKNKRVTNMTPDHENIDRKVGLFYLVWNCEEQSLECLHKLKDPSSALTNEYFTPNGKNRFKEFIKDEIFSCFEEPKKDPNSNINFDMYIKCYTCLLRKGFAFRAMSRDNVNDPGWAVFQYTSENGKCYGVPGKLVTFIDFSMLKLKNEYKSKYVTSDIHVIIESLEKMPADKYIRNRHSNICTHVEISAEKRTDIPYLWCVSVNCILDVSYLIPDLGNPKPNQYIYVFPRHESLDNTTLEDSIGWGNKF